MPEEIGRRRRRSVTGSGTAAAFLRCTFPLPGRPELLSTAAARPASIAGGRGCGPRPPVRLRGHFTLTDSRPGVDAHHPARERRPGYGVLGTRASRPPSHFRGLRPRAGGTPAFPGRAVTRTSAAPTRQNRVWPRVGAGGRRRPGEDLSLVDRGVTPDNPMGERLGGWAAPRRRTAMRTGRRRGRTPAADARRLAPGTWRPAPDAVGPPGAAGPGPRRERTRRPPPRGERR